MWKPKFYHQTLGFNRHHWLSLAALILLVFEGVTGGLLAFYYQPSPERAFESVTTIRFHVFMGEVIHSMHAWGARFLVLIVLAHMLQTALQGDDLRRPSQWAWGTLALGVLLGMDLTGRLLPWTQTAYWNTVRALEALSFIPGLGPVLIFLIGGREVTSATLTRFYFSHVSLFALVLVLISLVHVIKSLRNGLRRAGPLRPVHPDLVYLVLNLSLLIFGLLASLAILFPPHHGEPADILKTPQSSRAPWYLAPILVVESVLSRTGGGGLFILFWTLILFLPRLDRRRRPWIRWLALLFGSAYIVLALFGGAR